MVSNRIATTLYQTFVAKKNASQLDIVLIASILQSK
jgi:hypothetical protein